MTEAEWLASTQPGPMLAFLRGRVGRLAGGPMTWTVTAARRRLRLFACACCRELWDELVDITARRAVQAAEGFADGAVKHEDFAPTRADARFNARGGSLRAQLVLRLALSAASEQATIHDGAAAAAGALIDRRARQRLGLSDGVEPYRGAVERDAWRAARREVGGRPAGLVRDIFGNPFRAAQLPARCRTGITRSLARAAYEEREMPSGHLDPARLAVLSDALEEAGCADDLILVHLRSPGPHVRGCWALDLVLGKQ